MSDDELDLLLAQSMEPVADDGFSEAVMAQISRQNKKERSILLVAFALAAVCLTIVVPPFLMSAIGGDGWVPTVTASLFALSVPFTSLLLLIES